MITNDSQHLIQIAETGVRNNDNVAFVRTNQRLAAEAAMRKPEAAKTRQQLLGEAYGEIYRQEQAQKEAIRAEKVRSGKLVIHPDGGWTEKL